MNKQWIRVQWAKEINRKHTHTGDNVESECKWERARVNDEFGEQKNWAHTYIHTCRGKTPKLGMFVLVATGLCPVLSFFNPLFVLQLFSFFAGCCCSRYSLSPIWMCVSIIILFFSSLSIDYYSNFLFRLNGVFCYSLFETWGQSFFLTPDAKSNIESGTIVYVCFFFYFIKCKIGCQKLASLGAHNSIKNIGLIPQILSIVDVVVVIRSVFFRSQSCWPF